MTQRGIVIQRNREGILDWDAFAKAREQARYTNASFIRPIADGLCFPEGCQQSGAASIARLRVSGAPPAITRLVISVALNAINGVILRWSRPHVGVEGDEILSPSFAHFDAATSIRRVVRSRWSLATRNHGVPRAVFGRARHAMCLSQRFHAFAAKATAGLLATFSEVRTRDDVNRSAVAYTPVATFLATRSWQVFNDKQTALSERFSHGAIVADIG